jgi:hypothetical protein
VISFAIHDSLIIHHLNKRQRIQTTKKKHKKTPQGRRTRPTFSPLSIREYNSDKAAFDPTSLIVDTNMKLTRAISLTNFMVATSALGFQVFVLYPWHKELDNGFEDLKKEHMKVLDAVGKTVSEQQRMAFSNRLSELKTESSRRWWWM